MKAIEFETTLNSDGMITVPDAFRKEIAGKKLKVTLSYEEEDSSKPPEHYTKGYDQKDTLYDAY